MLLARRVESTLLQASRAHPEMRPLVMADAARHAEQAEQVARTAAAFDAIELRAAA